jgi:hypothetical protein
MDLGASGGTLTFEERNTLDPLIVVKMIQQYPQVYRLEGSLKLRVSRHMPAEEARFEFAGELMKRLAGKAPVVDGLTGGKPNAPVATAKAVPGKPIPSAAPVGKPGSTGNRPKGR